jgi:3-hydroxybutyryl-CoA dehydratase
MIPKTIHDIALGDGASFAKTISETDVYLYAGITGDFNPAHIDEVYASQTFFKSRIAHGMLTAGLISAILGTRFPGPGTIYLRQELAFLAPVRIGDKIAASVEVIEKDPVRNRLRLRTLCKNQDGVTVLEGEALVSPPKVQEGVQGRQR